MQCVEQIVDCVVKQYKAYQMLPIKSDLACSIFKPKSLIQNTPNQS